MATARWVAAFACPTRQCIRLLRQLLFQCFQVAGTCFLRRGLRDDTAELKIPEAHALEPNKAIRSETIIKTWVSTSDVPKPQQPRPEPAQCSLRGQTCPGQLPGTLPSQLPTRLMPPGKIRNGYHINCIFLVKGVSSITDGCTFIAKWQCISK